MRVFHRLHVLTPHVFTSSRQVFRIYAYFDLTRGEVRCEASGNGTSKIFCSIVASKVRRRGVKTSNLWKTINTQISTHIIRILSNWENRTCVTINPVRFFEFVICFRSMTQIQFLYSMTFNFRQPWYTNTPGPIIVIHPKNERDELKISLTKNAGFIFETCTKVAEIARYYEICWVCSEWSQTIAWIIMTRSCFIVHRVVSEHQSERVRLCRPRTPANKRMIPLKILHIKSSNQPTEPVFV